MSVGTEAPPAWTNAARFSVRYEWMIPTLEQTTPKRLLFAPMVVLGLLIAAFVLEVGWTKSILNRIQIFHQTKSGWLQMPMSAGYFPSSLQISASGKVWTLTVDGLSRWDGS